MRARATLFTTCLAALALLTAPARAQSPAPEARASARELVETMRTVDQMRLIMPMILQQLKPAIVQGRPEVERDFDLSLPLVLEAMNVRLGELVDAIALIYATNFSADELRQVTAFYRTPVGQKFLEKLPAVTQQSLAIGQKFGQQLAGDLRERMVEQLRKKGHSI
jgi:hypothetical protein